MTTALGLLYGGHIEWYIVIIVVVVPAYYPAKARGVTAQDRNVEHTTDTTLLIAESREYRRNPSDSTGIDALISRLNAL